MPAELVSGRRL